MSNNFQPHRFPYEWHLTDGYPAKGVESHGKTVFGTFVCGGGSTMGYKLAGFHHLGGVEIDPKVAAVYKANNNPQFLYVEDIREFNKRTDLPAELYQLDVLDGSPPCTTFSMAGNREKTWGKQKRFAEGQTLQTLDDLVFAYCDTIAKLKPKVCLLENVAGLVRGNAKVYAKRIVKRLQEIGYNVQVFLLNAATMGVPQRRERVFFIGLRKDFHLPKLVLNFNEAAIPFGEIIDDNDKHDDLTDEKRKLWKLRKPIDTSFADINLREFGKGTLYTHKLTRRDVVSGTIISGDGNYTYDYPRHYNERETKLVSTFPVDFQNGNIKLRFFCGMSVPPVMTAQISYQIYKQWLSKL